MKEQGGFLSLLPWLFLAMLVVLAIAPYLNSHKIDVAEKIELGTTTEDVVNTKQSASGELSDIDELVGK